MPAQQCNQVLCPLLLCRKSHTNTCSTSTGAVGLNSTQDCWSKNRVKTVRALCVRTLVLIHTYGRQEMQNHCSIHNVPLPLNGTIPNPASRLDISACLWYAPLSEAGFAAMSEYVSGGWIHLRAHLHLRAVKAQGGYTVSQCIAVVAQLQLNLQSWTHTCTQRCQPHHTAPLHCEPQNLRS